MNGKIHPSNITKRTHYFNMRVRPRKMKSSKDERCKTLWHYYPQVFKEENIKQFCHGKGMAKIRISIDQYEMKESIRIKNTDQDSRDGNSDVKEEKHLILQNDTGNSHTSTSASPTCAHTSSLLRYLINLYPIRKHLQKIEFTILWVIIADTAIFRTAMSVSSLYLKLSFISRATAYSVDFTNAASKYTPPSSSSSSTGSKQGGMAIGTVANNSNIFTLPVWLIMHHFGVLGMHLFFIFYLAPKAPIEILLCALASQSSHNTWTKKMSLILYWVNVIVGVLAGLAYGCFLYDGGAGYAIALFVVCVVVTCVGILLLAGGSMLGRHIVVSVELRKETMAPKWMKKKHVGGARKLAMWSGSDGFKPFAM